MEQALSRYHSLHDEDSDTAAAWPVSSTVSAGISEAASIGSKRDGAEERLPASVDDLATAVQEQHLPEEQQQPGSTSEQTAEALHAPVLDHPAVSTIGGGIAEGGADTDGYVADADSPIRELPQGTPHHDLVAAAAAAAPAEVPGEATSGLALLASSAEDGSCNGMPEGDKRAFDGQTAAPATEVEHCAGLDNGTIAAVPLPVAPSPLLHVLASPGRQMSGEGSPMLQVRGFYKCLLKCALLLLQLPGNSQFMRQLLPCAIWSTGAYADMACHVCPGSLRNHNHEHE